jgi:hypothetical protein
VAKGRATAFRGEGRVLLSGDSFWSSHERLLLAYSVEKLDFAASIGALISSM